MFSSGLSYWTKYWRIFCNDYFRILNSKKFQSEKPYEYEFQIIIIFRIFVFITVFKNSIHYISFGNAIRTLFILNITILYTRNFLEILVIMFHFVLNENQIIRFFEIPKILSHLFIFPPLFLKKELKNIKKLNKITKLKTFTNKIITISSIIIGLLLFFNLYHLEILSKRKQHISLIKEVAKFWKIQKNTRLCLYLSFRLNDNEIFCNAGLGCESENIGQGRSYVEKNINVSFCFFLRYLEYSGYGGVICVTVSSCSMNVNYSMFYNCVCSGGGGAIYFISSNSCLRMICANSCSGSQYHFSHLKASQVNQVEYLSVSYCSHTTSGFYSTWLQSGHQRIDNTNSSMNNAYWGSGNYICSPSSFTSSHCTFSNNKVSQYICNWFESYSGTISMSYANIVQNNSPNYGVVFVCGDGIRKMMYCIFKNNQNTLFCVYGGSLEVSHSFIDHSVSFSTSTAVSTSNNNSFTNTITYQLQFFNSFHCNAEIPLPQQSLEETISRTNEETLRMTYERTIDITIRKLCSILLINLQ